MRIIFSQLQEQIDMLYLYNRIEKNLRLGNVEPERVRVWARAVIMRHFSDFRDERKKQEYINGAIKCCESYVQAVLNTPEVEYDADFYPEGESFIDYDGKIRPIAFAQQRGMEQLSFDSVPQGKTGGADETSKTGKTGKTGSTGAIGAINEADNIDAKMMQNAIERTKKRLIEMKMNGGK